MKKAIKVAILALAATPTVLHADQDWSYRLSPYLWFAGIEGDISTVEGSPVIPIDISSSDALRDNELSLMFIFEAKKQRHGMLIDFLYTDTQSDTLLIDALNLNLKSTSKNTVLSAAYVYELQKQDKTSVDFFAGLRYWDIETKLKFEGGLGFLAGRQIKDSEDWIDPFLGIKGRASLGDSNFYVSGWAGLGGFGVGSDSFYDIAANIGYQWNNAIGTTLGYREFSVDYEDDGFVYDVSQPGWALGLTWAF